MQQRPFGGLASPGSPRVVYNTSPDPLAGLTGWTPEGGRQERRE